MSEADVKKQMTDGREQKIEVIEFGSGNAEVGVTKVEMWQWGWECSNGHSIGNLIFTAPDAEKT